MSKLFRRFIAAGTTAVMLAAVPLTGNAAAERFTDVKPGAWYYTAVDYAVGEKLFSGTSATTFKPDGDMTRGMFVRVLGNKAGIDPGEYLSGTFSDVQADAWYAPQVEWAAKNDIVKGVGNGRFAPEQKVTREQMAVILYNYAEYAGCDLTTRAGMLERYPDGGMVSGYARYAMEWAVTHDIIKGSGGKLNPKGTATRAQVAQIFYNSRELLEDGGEEPKPPSPSPSPSPSPDPDTPRISITDEVRAKLRPNQNPEQILDYVLHGKHDDPTFTFDGTTAKWNPSLIYADDVARKYLGNWEDSENEIHGSAPVANGFIQMLTRTASDRFFITAKAEDGSFCMYYHPAETVYSQKMKELKRLLNLPSTVKYDRSLCFEGAGWAGPLSWDEYGGAKELAEKVEYYLTDMHTAIQYYLTEPEPGVFYLLYGE